MEEVGNKRIKGDKSSSILVINEPFKSPLIYDTHTFQKHLIKAM